MNSLVEDELPLAEAQNLRYDLLNILSDSELAYKLPGDNPSLGELCRELGETQYIYIQSFKTLKLDWSYQRNEPELASSVERLRAWYQALDEEFEAILRGLSEEDLQTRHIDRGRGFHASLFVQFQIFREALLVFYAKAIVYLKAMQKPLNEQWKMAIG